MVEDEDTTTRRRVTLSDLADRVRSVGDAVRLQDEDVLRIQLRRLAIEARFLSASTPLLREATSTSATVAHRQDLYLARPQGGFLG